MERYRESLQETYGYLKLSKLDVTYRSKAYQVNLGKIFIPQTVKEALPPSRYDLPKEVLEKLQQEEAIEANFFDSNFEQYQQLFLGKPSQSVLDIVRDDKYHYIVFLGDPGSGKSTLLQYLALDWADNPTEQIPLLIELRDYAKDENDPQDFLDYFHQGKRKICELNKQQLHEQFNTGKAVVMFDGLDEIFSKDIYGRVIKEIHAFSNKYPQVSIIITSRIVGYNPDELSNAEFTHFTLEEFNNSQIREFIKRWHKLELPEESSQDRYDTQKRLQTAVKDSPAIRQLAGNPLLLTMMAILNRYQELPRRRIDLYKQSTDVLLHQWEIEYKKIELTLDDVDLRAKQGMLRDIAYQMQGSDKGLKGNIIHRDNLEEAIADYYYNRLRGTKAQTIAGKIIDQLRKRDFILCYLGKDYYGFVHRTFLEYFCAMAFIDRFNKRGKEGGLSIDELKEEVFGKHWQDKSWHEVLRLIAGNLNEFVGDIINYLIDIYEQNKEVDVLILAAECLDEVDSKVDLKDIENMILDSLKAALENDKEVREVAKTITKYWQNNSEVMEWLEDIALNHNTSEIRKAIAQGIADIKLNNLEARDILISDIADVYYNQNKYEKALSAYLRNGFNHVRFYPQIYNIYVHLKQSDEAITYINNYINDDNSDFVKPFLYCQLGETYNKLGDYQEAVRFCRISIEKVDEEFGDIHYISSLILGEIYYNWGKYEDAIKIYNKIISIMVNNLNPIAYKELGKVYYILGKDNEAISAFDKAIEIDDKHSHSYNDLGYYYRLQKQWDKAIDYLNTAIEFNPFYSIAYHNLGVVYLLQDNLDEAKILLTKAVEVNSYNGRAFLRLGILQALEENIDQAKISWQKGLKWYGEYAQHERLFRTIYMIALGEIEQGLTTLRTILSEEKPPIGLLKQVLEIAYLLKRCPQLEGINEAIIMIENNINYQL